MEKLSDNLKNLILKHALKNAINYKGKASLGAVLGKVLAEKPELRKRIGDVKKEVEKIVLSVNALSLSEQEARLLEIAPELLQKEKAEVRLTLPNLPHSEKEKVVMRFEPSPTGALHIGHAITFLLNVEYCKKYNGKLFLRIADTNPAEIYEPAYRFIIEEAKWLSDWPFIVKFQSDNIEKYYKIAEKLIKKGKAYVCTCSTENFRHLINKKKACSHRDLDVKSQLSNWKKMHSKTGFKSGEAVLRIKTRLDEKNPALRDWPAFRILDIRHPRKGDKFRVWPLMNFAVAVDDANQGITHVIRGKDHVVNTERQLWIFDYMNWKKPTYIHIGRINFRNMKLSSSNTREAIEKRKFSGWDDIRLPFISALKKRGIQREALASYVLEIGPSKVDKTLNLETFMNKIYDYNRKILDPITKRFFFIPKPVRVKIRGAPSLKVKLPLHPEKNFGYRNFSTFDTFYLDKNDVEQIKKSKTGKVFRLMYLLNFTKEKDLRFHSLEMNPSLKAKLIHWLPADPKQVCKIKVLMPSGKKIEGLAEAGVEKLKEGVVIQFERFGFCCKQENAFWFAHK